MHNPPYKACQQQAGRLSALVAVAAVVALAGLAFPSGLAADQTTMPEGNDMAASPSNAGMYEQARFDADSIDSRVQAAVVGALMLYWTNGTAAFDLSLPRRPLTLMSYTRSSWMPQPLRRWRTGHTRTLRV